MKNLKNAPFSAALAVALWLASLDATYSQSLTFTTLAGSVGHGSADGTGSAALFYYPCSVATDSGGNVYVADQSNQTIRKISPNGAVKTFAGLAGYSGSADGMGSAARFLWPQGIAVDGAGTVYVADTGNHAIRKITPGGAVTTLAGLAGTLGKVDGSGRAARFNQPAGVAVDRAGNLYVADWGNHAIRTITPDGTVTTLAGLLGTSGSADGTGSAARFLNPESVAVDNAANVYVADSGNHTLRKITPAGAVTTLAGLAGSNGNADGTGRAARFNFPIGVVVDNAGNIYVVSGKKGV